MLSIQRQPLWDWGQEEKGTTEDEMAVWHHWFDGHEFEWTPGVDDRPGGLVCCDSWGRKESDTTEQLNWTYHRCVLAFHILRCVTLIKSLNLSFLIWKMGTMLILEPFRLHTCLQRADGPERAFWVPESGSIMNYSATWGEGNLLFRGYSWHPEG